MLYLEKDPILCADATPTQLILHSINSAKTAVEYLKNPKQDTLEEGSLALLLVIDWNFSFKNIEWCEKYLNRLCENIGEPLRFHLIEDLVLEDTTDDFYVNDLKIHSPLVDEHYADICEENKVFYRQIENDIMGLSRQILADLKPEYCDFVHGQPYWLKLISDEVFSAYDMAHRKHLKITRKRDGSFKYLTSNGGSWKEINDVPSEIDSFIDYLLSNRANLTLTYQT